MQIKLREPLAAAQVKLVAYLRLSLSATICFAVLVMSVLLRDVSRKGRCLQSDS